MNGDYFIKQLELQPHPEGGYYKETYRSAACIHAAVFPGQFPDKRSFLTSIYYLLEQGDCSVFHRIKSAECWHFYAGHTLLIHVIEHHGTYSCIRLGNNLAEGETFQFVVPANTWFASEPAPNSSFSLAGCTVAPGFDFANFEIGSKANLLDSFPQHRDIIEKLTRQD